MDNSYGPWKPLELDGVVLLFEGWPRRWWITGGVALELCLGRSWRSHKDSDVSVLRDDLGSLAELMVNWDLHVAAAGVLTQWDGTPLRAQESQDNIWCRRAPDQPWSLDITISEGDDEHWIYRRDPNLRVLWSDAVLRDEQGIPYLAPDLQLLFKSEDHREKDDRDFAEVLPDLEPEQRQRLVDCLAIDHPWRGKVMLPRDRT